MHAVKEEKGKSWQQWVTSIPFSLFVSTAQPEAPKPKEPPKFGVKSGHAR